MILAVLSSENEEAITPREIFQRLGIEQPTPYQRASLSRTLARLSALCLVVGFRRDIEFKNHNWSPSAASGYWLATPEGRAIAPSPRCSISFSTLYRPRCRHGSQEWWLAGL
jgi:hypothetical protein